MENEIGMNNNQTLEIAVCVQGNWSTDHREKTFFPGKVHCYSISPQSPSDAQEMPGANVVIPTKRETFIHFHKNPMNIEHSNPYNEKIK